MDKCQKTTGQGAKPARANKPKDDWTQEIYKAEDKARFAHTGSLPSLPVISGYVHGCLADPRVRREFPFLKSRLRVQIGDGRGSESARATKNSIEMPVWSRYMGVALHELTHVIQSNHLTWGDEPDHGRRFVAIMLKLTQWFDPKYHKRLLTAFKSCQVPIKKQTRFKNK